jgi:uncharacterized protein YjiS (DUF1127 family)
MSRLTEKEIDLIQSARAARLREPAGSEHVIQKARSLQSEAAAEMANRVLLWTGLSEAGAWLYDSVVCPAAEAMQRRRTVMQLQRLDDHLLRDIGLERGLIESFGESLSARTVAPRRAVDGPIARCRRWALRRRTVRELEALSDRELADIGVVRGQIEQIAERAVAPLRSAPAARPRRARKGVSAASVESLAYQALKVDPPLRPKAARPIDPALAERPASEAPTRVLPLWIGPWLPAAHRDAA